jgi:histidinol-phosphatase (PHP family)
MDWQDYYYVNFNSPELCYAFLDDYFHQMEQLMDWGNFDALAHLPYPLRYMVQRDGQPVTLHRYEDQIIALLRRLIQSGKALEVNSAKSLPLMPEYSWLLGRYRELGGELVTAGSDAHRVADAGVGLEQVYDLIQAKGFRYITIFRGRKPCPVRL